MGVTGCCYCFVVVPKIAEGINNKKRLRAVGVTVPDTQQQQQQRERRTGSCIYNETPVLRLPPEQNHHHIKKRYSSQHRFPFWQQHHFHNELYVPVPQQRDDIPQHAIGDERIIVLLFDPKLEPIVFIKFYSEPKVIPELLFRNQN